LQPHLAQLYRASESRRRLRAALALHESSEAANMLLEADDHVGAEGMTNGEIAARLWVSPLTVS